MGPFECPNCQSEIIVDTIRVDEENKFLTVKRTLVSKGDDVYVSVEEAAEEVRYWKRKYGELRDRIPRWILRLHGA